MPTHLAYIPLDTYPEAVADDAILASVRFAGLLDHKLHVETFAVDIPQMTSPLGGFASGTPPIMTAVAPIRMKVMPLASNSTGAPKMSR